MLQDSIQYRSLVRSTLHPFPFMLLFLPCAALYNTPTISHIHTPRPVHIAYFTYLAYLTIPRIKHNGIQDLPQLPSIPQL